jgi:hypothetical protein
VVWLSECEGFDSVWVVVDSLSKMHHVIPYQTHIDAVGLSKLFLHEVVPLHGRSKTVVSHRRPQFGSTLWGQICSQLGIDRRISTASHPQPDGQTKQMNFGTEQYLWVFVNHEQHTWVQCVPCAEFCMNNGISESMKCTPIVAVQSADPWMSFAGEPTPERDEVCLDADQVQAVMQQVHEHLQVEIRWSQALQEDGTNRGHIPAPNLQVRSKVWLDVQNIRATRPTRKWVWKRWAPFGVCRQVSLPSTSWSYLCQYEFIKFNLFRY